MIEPTPTLRDGDVGFIGFASRLNPLTLPPGVLQMAENVRLDRGVAQTRKGALRLARDVNPGEEPLTVPFVLGEDIAVTLAATLDAVTATTASPHGFTSGDQVNISGADDAEYNGDFIITVTATDEFTYTANSAPVAATDAGVANQGPVVKAVYSGGIFAAGVYSSPVYDNGKEYIVLCGPGAAYLWRDGVSLVTRSYPSSPDEVIEPTDTVSVVQAFDRLYVLRQADPTVTGWGRKLTNLSGVTVSGTEATVHVTGHGYEVGQRVRLEGSTVAAFAGHEFDVATVVDPDSFTIAVPSGTASAGVAGIVVQRVKAPIYWDGLASAFVRSPGGVPAEGPTYRYLRSSGWAKYSNGRLVVPDGRDAVALSDIGDPDLYDPYWNTFRANQGSNDRLVAVHPWAEGAFLAFFRSSIWLAEINQLSVAQGNDTLISRLTLLTDEVGCSARKSIATAGQYVYFLSDSGVYRLDARLDLKLRGDTKPLSDSIADQFESLNAEQVDASSGVWYNNRYYLAVPVGPLADNNNTLYIYSALNEQWESRDIYGFGIADFLVSEYNNERRLMVSNRAGGLLLLDENEAGDSAADADVLELEPVQATIVTRRYSMGSMADKRWLRVLAEVVLPATGAVKVSAGVQNPDKTLVLGTLTNPNAQDDFSMKFPIRAKGHFLEMKFETTVERPQIRTVSVEAAGKASEPTETRNVA
jgi:hypothetical protein